MSGSLSNSDFDQIEKYRKNMKKIMKSFFNTDDLNIFSPEGSRNSSKLVASSHDRHETSPFGFPDISQMMRRMRKALPDQNNSHSYTSRTVMSVSNGPDRKPQVHQVSESTRAAPGNIRETRKALIDSRAGVKKMAIGHHIGEKGYIQEQKLNLFTGQMERNYDYINIDEEQAPEFLREWQKKTSQFRPTGISYQSSHRRHEEEKLARPCAISTHENNKGMNRSSHRQNKSESSKSHDKLM